MNKIEFNNLRLDEHRVSADICVPKEFRKYTLSKSMFLNFDTNIHADDSILYIPFITTLLPLAWLTGTNIYVDRLDQKFTESMNLLQKDFAKWYPNMSFNTEIQAGELVENKTEVMDLERNMGLLFSGGVDSTYSMITNLEHKPSLIMIWGVDGYPYPENSEYWKKVISIYSGLANRKGLNFHIIETDALRVLHSRRIEHDFHNELLHGSLWVRFQFALFMLPLVAPLSVGRFNRLLLAAGHDPTYRFSEGPEAIEPMVDNVYWANLQCKLDGFIPRINKINRLQEQMKSEKIDLRVCQKHRILGPDKLNCSSCEKCYRTIVPLILNKIDPNDCGFDVNESTYQEIKSFFIKKKIPLLHIEDQWKPIQNKIPEKIETDYMSSKSFFEWFKNFDLTLCEKDVWFYLKLYDNLPWFMSKALNELYKVVGINIHDHSPFHAHIDLEKKNTL